MGLSAEKRGKLQALGLWSAFCIRRDELKQAGFHPKAAAERALTEYLPEEAKPAAPAPGPLEPVDDEDEPSAVQPVAAPAPKVPAKRPAPELPDLTDEEWRELDKLPLRKRLDKVFELTGGTREMLRCILDNPGLLHELYKRQIAGSIPTKTELDVHERIEDDGGPLEKIGELLAGVGAGGPA
jgi:hypothetical protein